MSGVWSISRLIQALDAACIHEQLEFCAYNTSKACYLLNMRCSHMKLGALIWGVLLGLYPTLELALWYFHVQHLLIEAEDKPRLPIHIIPQFLWYRILLAPSWVYSILPTVLQTDHCIVAM